MIETDRCSTQPLSLVLVWVVRAAFSIVFFWNVQCALQFVFTPDAYCASFLLETDVAGRVAVQGMGIAFLMWNATYPAFIFNPARFRVLGWVILIQQLIGLVGESAILAEIGTTYSVLALSIFRFVLFDAAGLVLMAIPFVILIVRCARMRKTDNV